MFLLLPMLRDVWSAAHNSIHNISTNIERRCTGRDHFPTETRSLIWSETSSYTQKTRKNFLIKPNTVIQPVPWKWFELHGSGIILINTNKLGWVKPTKANHTTIETVCCVVWTFFESLVGLSSKRSFWRTSDVYLRPSGYARFKA